MTTTRMAKAMLTAAWLVVAASAAAGPALAGHTTASSILEGGGYDPPGSPDNEYTQGCLHISTVDGLCGFAKAKVLERKYSDDPNKLWSLSDGGGSGTAAGTAVSTTTSPYEDTDCGWAALNSCHWGSLYSGSYYGHGILDAWTETVSTISCFNPGLPCISGIAASDACAYHGQYPEACWDD